MPKRAEDRTRRTFSTWEKISSAADAANTRTVMSGRGGLHRNPTVCHPAARRRSRRTAAGLMRLLSVEPVLSNLAVDAQPGTAVAPLLSVSVVQKKAGDGAY